jgi:hypothetical protein
LNHRRYPSSSSLHSFEQHPFGGVVDGPAYPIDSDAILVTLHFLLEPSYFIVPSRPSIHQRRLSPHPLRLHPSHPPSLDVIDSQSIVTVQNTHPSTHVHRNDRRRRRSTVTTTALRWIIGSSSRTRSQCERIVLSSQRWLCGRSSSSSCSSAAAAAAASVGQLHRQFGHTLGCDWSEL